MVSVGAAALRPVKQPAGRFSYLLILLLALLVLSPFAGSRGRILLVLAGLVVLAALYAIGDRRKIWWAALALAIPAFLHRITASAGPSTPLGLAGLICSILFDFFITVFILAAVASHKRVRKETI